MKKQIMSKLLIIAMIITSTFVPINVDAATANVNTITDSVWTDSERNIGIMYDADSDIHDPTHKAGVMSAPSYFSANGTQVYCIDPPVTFHNGTKAIHNAVGFRNISQADLDYLSAGKFYVDSQNLTSIQKTALTQALIWKVLGERNRGYRIRSINLYDNVRLVRDYQGDFWKYEGGTVSTTLNTILANATNYAREHQGEFTGTANVYYNAGEVDQATMSLSYVRKGFLKLKKTTASNSHLTELCPENYTVEGAIYGVYSNASATNKVGELVVDANGDSNTLRLNRGNYYAKEISAPKGYGLDPKTYSITVTEGNTAILNVEDEPLFDPLSLVLYKKAENGADKNLPLEGAEYTVKYYKEQFKSDEEAKAAVPNLTPFRTWVFRTDENGAIHIDEEHKVGGGELFISDNDVPVGILGTYSFEETKAPKGFAKTEGLVAIRRVTQDYRNNTIQAMNDIITIEKTQKADIKVKKIDKETGEAKAQGFGTLKGAIYEVFKYDKYAPENEKVGEITTDENGVGILSGLELGVYYVMEKTASAGYLIDSKTHEVLARATAINTPVFEYSVTSEEQPTTIEVSKTGLDENGVKGAVAGAELQLYDSNNKLIYTWTTGENAQVLKALPVGNYTIKETKAPKGYLPLEKDVTFTVKATPEIQGVDVFNERIPEISTKALFEGGTKNSLTKETKVIDKIDLKNLYVGHPYKYIGKVLNAKDNSTIATSEMTFTAEDVNMTKDLIINIDLRELANTKLVVTGELHRTDRVGETKVAEHNDLDNLNQTLTVPDIKTTATDKAYGSKDILASKTTTIVDTVKYTNLFAGKEYTVKGTLMDKETNKPILVNGKEVTAEKTFTAENSDGSVELEFIFDSSALKGKTVVAFEDLYEGEIKVGTHADIEDREQTIYFPKIGTTATNQADGMKEILPIKNITVRDMVRYENLFEGAKYQLEGQLVRKSDKEIIAEESVVFRAMGNSDEIPMDFFFSAEKLAGEELVVFETLYRLDDEGNKVKVVAEHKDLNDKGQTVKITKPEIGTEARDKKDGDKLLAIEDNVTIIDVVKYSNLVTGKEYTVKGTLMDKSTNMPLIVNGKEVTAEKTFTAENSSGSVELEFTFDSRKLSGKEIVVFEKIYHEGIEIGTHADINDRGQTVKVELPPPHTGDTSYPYVYILCAILLAGFLAILKVKYGSDK